MPRKFQASQITRVNGEAKASPENRSSGNHEKGRQTNDGTKSNLMAAQTPLQTLHPNLVLVKDMHPNLRKFDCQVIVLQKGEPEHTRDGTPIFKFLVADKTGSIQLSVWDSSAGQCIQGGDILLLTGTDCNLRKGFMQLAISRTGKLKRLGQDTFPFSEKPNFSEHEYQAPTGNLAANRSKQTHAVNPRVQNAANSHSTSNKSFRGRGGRGGRGANRGGRRGLKYSLDLDNPDNEGHNRTTTLPADSNMTRRDSRLKRSMDNQETEPLQRTRRKVEYNELQQPRRE